MGNTVNITLSMLNIISTLKVWTWSKPKFSLKSYYKISGTRPGPQWPLVVILDTGLQTLICQQQTTIEVMILRFMCWVTPTATITHQQHSMDMEVSASPLLKRNYEAHIPESEQYKEVKTTEYAENGVKKRGNSEDTTYCCECKLQLAWSGINILSDRLCPTWEEVCQGSCPLLALAVKGLSPQWLMG